MLEVHGMISILLTILSVWTKTFVTTEVMKLLGFVQINGRRKCALVTSTLSYVKGTSLLQTTDKAQQNAQCQGEI